MEASSSGDTAAPATPTNPSLTLSDPTVRNDYHTAAAVVDEVVGVGVGAMPSSEKQSASSVHSPVTRPCVVVRGKSKREDPNPNSKGFIVGQYRVSYCPICLEGFTLDNPAVLVPCRHVFHMQCYYAWRERSRSCAVCCTLFADDMIRIMSGADVADLGSGDGSAASLPASCSVASLTAEDAPSPCAAAASQTLDKQVSSRPNPSSGLIRATPTPHLHPAIRSPSAGTAVGGKSSSRRVFVLSDLSDSDYDDADDPQHRPPHPAASYASSSSSSKGGAARSGEGGSAAASSRGGLAMGSSGSFGRNAFMPRAATACRNALVGVRRIFACFSTPSGSRHPPRHAHQPQPSSAQQQQQQ